MENRSKIGVGVIVIKDGKILLGKRKNAHVKVPGVFQEGIWNLTKR